MLIIESEEEYLFISVNHNSLSGDGNYFIGGLVNDDFYDYYGGTFRSDYNFYSPRQGGNSFQA